MGFAYGPWHKKLLIRLCRPSGPDVFAIRLLHLGQLILDLIHELTWPWPSWSLADAWSPEIAETALAFYFVFVHFELGGQAELR